MPSPASRSRRVLPVLAPIAISVAACGGSAAPPLLAGATPTGAAGSTQPPAAAAGVAGAIGYRIVHLYRHPDGTAPALDIYARTGQGVISASLVQAGAPHGTVTDWIHPPTGGTVVATEAGNGDPACFTSCPHLVLDASLLGGQGDRRTELVYPESPIRSGETPADLAGTIEFWEDPDPASVGSMGNALMPADPARGLLFAVAVAVDEARFGMRLAFDGEPGCQDSINQPGQLVGGNQILAFPLGSRVEVTLHQNGDSDCSEDAIGGPFSVGGGAGSRDYLILHGEFGDMEALVVPID